MGSTLCRGVLRDGHRGVVRDAARFGRGVPVKIQKGQCTTNTVLLYSSMNG